jgi:excisionase family DNA binding protein
MENELRNELRELKELTLLGAKQALSVKDACLLTGLSRSYLYKLVCYKEIPYYKSGGGKLTYFDKSEINEWCLKHRVSTNEEIEQAAALYCVTGKHRKGGK